MPLTAKDRGRSWLLSLIKKSSIIHHARGNSMASPIQTVVDKGISNPLIAEGLLKTLRDLILPSLPKSLTNPIHGMVGPQKACDYFSSKIITDQTCQVNIIPLAYSLLS